MGVINRGILGGFRNKVGPVVGSSWKGIDVIKSKPASVANPNTPGQQEQRNAMRAINVFLRSFGLDNVKTLNNAMSVRMSGFNRCMKKVNTFKPGNELSGHVKCVASGSYPKPSLAAHDTFTVEGAQRTVTVDWASLFGENPQPTGTRAMVTIMDPDGTICTPAVFGTATASDTVISVAGLSSINHMVAGACYISADGLQTSDVVTVVLE